MFNIEMSSHTDIGDVKQTNQDCIFSKNDIVNGHCVGVFIVADGCGGMAYGEEISNLIVTHFARVWNHELKDLLQQHTIKAEAVDELLEKAIRDINAGALAFSRQVESKVGSTLSLLLTIDKRFYIKNVGDSRIYLLRGKKIKQLTQDQSLVADKVRNGEITEEEAKNFKQKNVLTMCIGVFENIRTFSKQGKIKKKDTFLLCCDGVHNHVSPEKMLEIVKNKKSPFEGKAEEIRNSIEPGKANDNVSSVVCRFKRNRIRKREIFAKILISLLLLVLVAISVLVTTVALTNIENENSWKVLKITADLIAIAPNYYNIALIVLTIAIAGGSAVSLLIMAFQGFKTKKRIAIAIIFALLTVGAMIVCKMLI